MAVMKCHFFSSTLFTNISINVILPTPQGGEEVADPRFQAKYDYEKGLPVVFLLHGAFGNADSWIRFSNVERYAQERGLAVVMASAENSFYQDMAHGQPYKTFFLKELISFVRSIYPVSRSRENTYIGGFSMGGYGAWYLALTRPDLFSKAASMSGAVDFPGLVSSGINLNGAIRWGDILGDNLDVAGTDKDLMYLYDKCVAEGTVPALFQACATGDSLYQPNVGIRDRLMAKNADLVWYDAPGGHDWNFWDATLSRMFDWMLGR